MLIRPFIRELYSHFVSLSDFHCNTVQKEKYKAFRYINISFMFFLLLFHAKISSKITDAGSRTQRLAGGFCQDSQEGPDSP